MPDSLGDRMKGYENISRIYLTKRMPLIIRIDGKAFHTFTRGFQKPFDPVLMKTMQDTAQFLCENIMGCKVAYTQSDEISLLLTDYDDLTTEPWFEKNLQKIVSISASMATMAFNRFYYLNTFAYIASIAQPASSDDSVEEISARVERWKQAHKVYDDKFHSAMFDARAFVLPKEEVCNYFIWRQQDASRNSVEMVGRAYFSDRELFKKTCSNIQDMLMEQHQVNWNDMPVPQKRGTCIVKEQYDHQGTIRNRWVVDENIPIFTTDRTYIEKFVMVG